MLGTPLHAPSSVSPLQPTALLVLPALGHRACTCWICFVDEALPVVEYSQELERAMREDALDNDASWLAYCEMDEADRAEEDGDASERGYLSYEQELGLIGMWG